MKTTLTRRAVLGAGLIGVTGLSTRAASFPPVRARQAMVSAASSFATDAGIAILKRGGNAVDAAVAVGLAQAVTWPSAGNIGGGGFMLIQLAGGKSATIDYREIAPRRAQRNMYLDANGKLDSKLSTIGHLSCGVPGTVAGMALALKKYGSMQWREVIDPAIHLAVEGFAVSAAMSRMLRTGLLNQFPESYRIFQRDGKLYQEGEILRQPELAATLRRLQKQGPEEFYQGETAKLLAAEMRAHDGLIDLEDLKSYRALERSTLRGAYWGNEVVSVSPAASGGVVLIEMLNMLERFDITKLGQNSSARYHILIEVMKRAFADRAELIGDPAFVKAPIDELISKEYAVERARSIDPRKATPSAQIRSGKPARKESSETTHYSVVDSAGNAVSNTYTLRNGFGSGVTVKGAGFLLNDVMDDFATQPGQPNTFGFVAGEANAIAAGRRPVSSQTPTIVNKDGQVWLVAGSPGGPTISNTVLQVVSNMIDYGMDLQEAVDAPRIHHQWMPDTLDYEPGALSQDVSAALVSRGHILRRGAGTRNTRIGTVNAVAVEPATERRLGANDPRNPDGKAAGY